MVGLDMGDSWTLAVLPLWLAVDFQMKLMSLSTVACGTCFLAAANITPGELAFLLDRSSMYVCSVGITDLISGHSQTLSQYICNMLFYDNVTKAFKCNKISTIIIIIIMIIIIISVITHWNVCMCVWESSVCSVTPDAPLAFLPSHPSRLRTAVDSDKYPECTNRAESEGGLHRQVQVSVGFIAAYWHAMWNM